jgi:hypothetical protein
MHDLASIKELNSHENIKQSQKLARSLNGANEVCPEHPRYKGLRAPRVSCERCLALFNKKIGR